MYPLNDNDLDRLSREAAEQYDVDPNPSTSGWEALEGRLNKEMPVDEKKRRRFLFWLFFIAATAGGGLWYIMAGNDTDAGRIAHVATAPTNTNNDAKNSSLPGEPVSPNPVNSQQETGAGTQPVSAQPTAADKSTAAEKASAAGQPTGTQPAATTPAQRNLATSAEPRAHKANTPAGNKTTPATSTWQQKTTPTTNDLVIGGSAGATRNTNNKTVNKKNGSKPQRTTKQPGEVPPTDHVDDFGVKIGNVSDAQKTEPVAATKTNNSSSDQTTDTAAVAKATAPPVTPPAAKDTTATTVATAKKPAKRTDNKKTKGFEIGLVAGPDASNVKFYDAGQVGFNAGVQVGYRFSDHWSVNTGAIYTKKNYVANGRDVTLYGYMAQPGVKVNTMEGYCTMWDFPINVRYDFAVNNKRRFFASTGLSTYLMNRENYDYYYNFNNNPERTYNWDSKERGINDTTYLFSILNLSVGFERMISKKFSLQAEPYFKLPMSQLGHGKLNLNSYGIYFSVKYRIAK